MEEKCKKLKKAVVELTKEHVRTRRQLRKQKRWISNGTLKRYNIHVCKVRRD